MKKIKEKFAQGGFTLVELIVVVAVISIIAVISYASLYSDRREVGGAERVLEESAARVVERRSEAIRLNGEDRQLAVAQNVPPLPIDFTVLAQTASLTTEGDADGDCLDDVTGLPVTCLVSGINSTWQTARRSDALSLPSEWAVAQSSADLGGIPLIGGGSMGRGILVTQVGFDPNGAALAIESNSSGWVAIPSGAVINDSPAMTDAPFWAIYLVGTNSANQVTAAVAVAVHPSGLIERFRFDGTNWIGFQNRVL